jgi:hypothetical protein
MLGPPIQSNMRAKPFPIVASKLSEVFVRLDWQGEEQDGRCVPVHRRGR